MSDQTNEPVKQTLAAGKKKISPTYAGLDGY